MPYIKSMTVFTRQMVNSFGVMQTVAECAAELGITVKCIKKRVDRGMSLEEACTTPKLKHRMRGVSVVQMDGIGNVMEVHNTVRDAAAAVNPDNVDSTIRGINHCLSGARATAYGFKWRWNT